MEATETKMDYDACVALSERVAWKVDDVFGGRKVDLGRDILPPALALMDDLPLSADEKRKLNQIRGGSYAYLFFFIEESILQAVLAQSRACKPGERAKLRALLRFAEEEVKHQELFLRFFDEVERGLGVKCGRLAERVTASDVAMSLAQAPALSVMLTLLHIEWVSQRHFVEAFKDNSVSLDPLFCDILRSHWLEEAQHTKVDLLLLEPMVAQATPEEIEAAIEGYMGVGKSIDGLLYQQVELDVGTLERAIGRTLSPEDREKIIFSQAYACRKALLWLGMTHPPFVAYLTKISPAGAAKVAAMATAIA